MPERDDAAHTSFVTLFTRLEARLRSFVRSLLPGWPDVDDVMQQVGLLVWRKFEQFDPATEFLPWACVIAGFEALHYRRSMARDRLVFGEELIQQLAEEGAAELELRAAQVQDAQGREVVVRESQPLPLEEWQFVAFTLDGAMLRLYRNGLEVAASPCVGLSAAVDALEKSQVGIGGINRTIAAPSASGRMRRSVLELITSCDYLPSRQGRDRAAPPPSNPSPDQMTRSKTMRAIPSILTLLLASPAALQAQDDPAKKPNIVIIVADDLGYADVLFNPQHPKEVTTPHLDALAKQSVICRQSYVSGHVCSPTRAGLMTGRYQQRLGLYTGGEAGSGLPMDEKIFPQHLKPASYATAQFGKWHLGPDPAWSPALRGFDEVFGFLGRGAHDYFKLNDPDDPIYRGTTPVQETGYLTDRLGDEAAAFITRKKAQPFFVYLAFNAVHAPLQAPADEIAKFNSGNADRNTLLAMGKRMDDAIGKVVATLKAEGVWENTLLFFISDNGGPLAHSAVNTPLRGGKHQDYEGGIRVPFLACWPGKLKPGENQAPMISLDILPTALAAAGLSAADAKPFDGKNILPILRGEESPQPRNLFWSSGSEEGWWAVRSEKSRVGLFDLSKDVGEKADLAKQMPEKVAALTKLHGTWLAEMAIRTN